MALDPEDPSSGFRHGKVLEFINEQMARHAKGPEFYTENLSLSWKEVEDKLRAILDDSEVSSEAQVACVWGSLALGVRFAHRQGHLQGRRVHWLHDFATLHKSAAQALAADLKQVTEQQEMERKEAAFQLQVAHAKLAEMQKERDLLRVKLFQAVRSLRWFPPRPTPKPVSRPSPQDAAQRPTSSQELRALPVAENPGLATATAGGAGSLNGGGGEKKEVVVATVGATGRGGTREGEKAVEWAARVEATGETDGSFQQLLGTGTVKWKNYPLGGQREGELTAKETAMYSLSGTRNPRPPASSEPLTVQLPASFTYSYESPILTTSTPSPPPAMPVLPQVPSYYMASDISLPSDVGPQGLDLQELQKDARDSEPQQQRKTPVFRRPGDWDCPWCKAVNFSRRESCFRCGRGIWLQSP